MRTNTRKFSLALVVGLALVIGLVATALAGTFEPVTVTDQALTAPVANPVPSSYQPRYISGFGSDNSFTVFFEDRDATPTKTVSYVSTTTGPTGFLASATATNIVTTHFLVKDWPINIGGTDYAYRAWASVGNNTSHEFYVSNDLTNWTLVSTFAILNAAGFVADARGWVYYGFYDVIQLNDTYYAFAESNCGQTMIVRSDNGDDVWEAFASVGGTEPDDGPLETNPPPGGIDWGWTPTGSFIDLGRDRGYGAIYANPYDTDFYLAVNVAAQASLSPAALEAAFINPANWTWHDGTTGPASNPILSETSEHDLRECWVVPNSDPDADWIIVYDADFGSADGGKALGYATLSPPLPPPSEVWVDDNYCDVCGNDGHTWGYDAFDNIQDGIDAVAGSTVHVANGNYNATTSNSTEWPGHPGEWWFVTIDKSLDLIGESRDGVILDGTALQTENRCTGIWVSASNVTVKNLTLQNFTQSPITAACYALYVMEKFRDYTWGNVATLDYVTAENVKAAGNMYAFYFMKTEHATIKDCVSDNNLGDGVWVAWGCDYATVQANTITNAGDHGIWVGKPWFSGPGSNDAAISNNTVNGAREGGISFVGSNNAVIHHNSITNAAGDGWSVGALSLKDGPTDVEAYHNHIFNNSGTWGGYNGTGHGVGIDGAASNINLHHNSIYGNSGLGVYNGSKALVMAEYNYWGSVDGPADLVGSDEATFTQCYDVSTMKNEVAELSGTLGNGASEDVDYCPWLGARYAKQDALAELNEIYPTGDEKVDKKLEKAIEHIQRSIDIDPKHPEKEPKHPIWLDETTLDPKHGKKCFDEEKKAVKELEHIIKDKKAAQDVKDACQAAIDALVAADKALAQTAIEEAIEAGGDPKEIAKAQDEMTKAQEELDHSKKDGTPDPRYDKAIDHYKKAWEHACKAQKTKAGPEGLLSVSDPLKVVAYPNPIRDVHTATFQVMGTMAAEVEEIRVQIYDLSGHLVWEDGALGSELDWHTDSLSGDYLANGIYLYRVQVRIGGSWINQDIGKIAVLR